MTLPTAEEITNRYLYSQQNAPVDLTAPSDININPREPVYVNTQEYMSEGAGRFVSAASFVFIREFFDDISNGYKVYLQPGEYSKHELLTEMGYFNPDTGLAVRDAAVSFNNLFHGTDEPDYAERTYIWGTVGFAVANDARFIVNPDGTRYVENFSIVPLQIAKTDSKKEDFDFTGGTISNIGNNLFGLYDTIDPSRIGKTVTFEFEGEVVKSTLTSEQFYEQDDKLFPPSMPDSGKIWALTDKLFAAGSTRFLQDNKPIIYGTAVNDIMGGDIANREGIDFHLASHRQLGQYVKNGIVYVAGDGNDLVIATQNNDVLLGGNGVDHLNSNAGDDYLEGGADADFLNPGAGLDHLNGGEGADTYQMDSGFGNVIIAGDTDGGTISLLSGVQFRRVSGKENQDGLFAAVDSKGEWIAGKEGWCVSVSGGCATATIVDADGAAHTIQIENFNIANNRFGIQLGQNLRPASIAQTGLYEVKNGVIGQHNGVDIYLPVSRSAENTDDGIDVERFRDTPLNFEQSLYPSAQSFEGSNRNDILTGATLQAGEVSRFDGRDGDDVLKGEANPDSAEGNVDILVGGRGNDQLYGGGGDDQLYASEQFVSEARTAKDGTELIPADYRAFLGWQFTDGTLGDAVKAGTVSIETRYEKNYLDGGQGNDGLYGASYQDILVGGAGNDFILAGAGQDKIAADDGDDLVYGDSRIFNTNTEGATTHFGTVDFIAPDAQQTNNSRAYYYQANRDTGYFDDMRNYTDVMDGGSGNDLLLGEIGNDNISGGAGDDRLFGDRPYNSGFFSDFANTKGIFQHLSAQYHGDDVLDGGSGHDRLIGGGGSDHLSGGIGNDVIYGDLGLNDYEYTGTATEGETAIRGDGDGWWGKDFILGGQGEDILIGEGSDDVIDGGAESDQLYGDWMASQTEAFTNPHSRTGNDTLYGGGGNDTLMGNSGDDALDGGQGDDNLFGDSYANGGLYTGSGNDALNGGAGTDHLYGGAGNDTLTGGSESDYLAGGEGDDIYIVEAGSGADVLEDTRGASEMHLSTAPVVTELDGDIATIYLSTDRKNSIRLSLDSLSHIEKINSADGLATLVIHAPDTNKTRTSNGYTQTYSALTGTQGDDAFVFSDGYQGQFTLAGFRGQDSIQVGKAWLDNGYLNVNVISDRWYKTESYWAGNHLETTRYYLTDYVLDNNANQAGTVKIYNDGWDSSEAIQLESGEIVNLNIIGNDEHNTIYGKSGNDWLSGNGGNDTLYGAAGNDTLKGGTGTDTLYGESGNDTLYVDGSDTASGGEGDDIFYAVANNSSGKVMGGAGADTFQIKAAEGSNFIITDQQFDAGDVIQLDVNADQVHLSAGMVVLLTADKSAENYVGATYLQDCPVNGFWDRLQGLSMRFANGETINADEIKLRSSTGTVFSDYIVGDASDNVFHGMANADTIYGLAGNDQLYGDAGNDYLIGGSGNDKFYFGLGQGSDVIDERMDAGWHGDADIVQFDGSVAQNSVVLTHKSNNLLVGFQNSSDTLTLAGFLAADKTNERNIKLQFSNGASMDMAYIEKEIFRRDSGLLQYGTATTANNTINGSTASNYIYGDAGNDVIDGKAGNDWIDGGAGNDTLIGGSGIDTFRFGAGSGQDVIRDSASLVVSDSVRLDFNTGIGNLTVEVLSATSELKIGRHNQAGIVTDAVRVSNALGHLQEINGNELAVGSTSLLEFANKQLANRVITLQRNKAEDQYVALSAKDILGNTLSDAEKSRWQIKAATQQSGHFGIDKSDGDGDGNRTEEAFFFAENFGGSGVNYVGFIPSENTGTASFQFTLQRDDGLTMISSMTVNIQSGTMTGTSGNDIVDGGQSRVGLVIDTLAGDDLVRDSYGNDVIHGGTGNDILTHNWAGNGDDIYYGDAGNDTLDAGWGSDTMVGGSGNDCYIENNLWSGDHTVIDNTTAAVGDIDTLQVGSEGYGTWDYRALWFTQSGNDLVMTQLDALEPGDIRIKDWFNAANPEARLDSILVQQDDGNIYEAWMGSKFDALVQAMAGFTPPASAGEIDLSLVDEYQAVWTLTTPAAA